MSILVLHFHVDGATLQPSPRVVGVNSQSSGLYGLARLRLFLSRRREDRSSHLARVAKNAGFEPSDLPPPKGILRNLLARSSREANRLGESETLTDVFKHLH